MNYYVKGDAAKAQQIKAAFEKLGIDVLDFGFADKTVVYCSIGGACVQSLPYSINLMHILHSHPGYKELELPVQPEFKVGDWVVRKDGETFYGGNYAEQITLIEVDDEGKSIWLSSTSWVFGDVIRPWTIQDAKDGDVLADYADGLDNPLVFILKRFEHVYYGLAKPSDYSSYCFLKANARQDFLPGTYHHKHDIKPATKKQRDLLFAKMKEAGYTWDEKKKELHKILKVGDWVAGIDDEGDMATEKIVSFSHNKVLLLDTDGCHTEYPKTELSNFRLWSIADAKDGDVLVSGIDNPFIYDGNIEFSSAGAYVGVSRNGRIRLDMFPSKAWTSIKDVKPATKEQRDLLFAKLLEAGCEWDAEKKELKKIQSHYDIANFHAGMPVLVRDYDNSRWSYVQFSHYVGECRMKFNACGIPYIQCIPYNDDTKHLLGTTDMCGEEYINW